MNNTIPIAEIFGPTIQGEGPHIGMKSIFVRVVGCDFNCDWCDSKFAWQFTSFCKRYTQEELALYLIDKCNSTNTNNVILTGGNPCLYDFNYIIDELHNHHIKVDVETQGSRFPNWLNKLDLVVISPKAPSSEQPDVFENIKNWILNEKKETIPVAIKIPIFTDDDFEFAKKYNNFIQDLNDEYKVKLYLSVGNDNTQEEGDISNRILQNYRKLIDMVNYSNMKEVYILPQMHTLLWGNRQGV